MSLATSLHMEGKKCYGCGEVGHFRKNCTNRKSTSKSVLNGDRESVQSNEPFVDTHCHLDLVYERCKFQGKFSKLKNMKRFADNFEGCITSFCDPFTVLCDELSSGFLAENGVWGAFGMHPKHSNYYSDEYEWKLVQCLEHPKAIALGEIGLDYSKNCTTPRDVQIHTFKRLLTWAVTLNKPVVVHCREAEEQLLACMIELLPSDWKIHVHCFTGGMDYARQFLTIFKNVYFGITNLVSFPNATEIHRQAKELPLERILIETDAPYFVPLNAKSSRRYSLPNDGIEVARTVASLRGEELSDVLKKIRINTAAVYGI